MPRGVPNKKPTENKAVDTEDKEVVQSVQARPDPSNRHKRRSSASSKQKGPLALTGDLDHEKYVYRVATDQGNRIQELIGFGFEVDKSQNVSFAGSSAVKTGSAHSVVVDKREGQKGVLMRQPREYHEEDKAAKAKLIDKTEESMFRKLKSEDGRYGDVENTSSLAKSVEE